MGFFGFGKKNKEKEQEKMKTGLEKTRTGFWGNILNTLTGSVIDIFEFEDANAALQARIDAGETELHLAEASAVLLGITKAALATDSFLSAASFQETPRCSPMPPSRARWITSSV